MSSTALTLQGLCKSMNGKPLLAIEHMRLQSGTAYALTGRNGSGKSTLLRIIAGLEPAEQGTLMRGEQKAQCDVFPQQYPQAWRRNIVYVHQQPLMLRGTVRSNVAYGMQAWRAGKQEAAASVNAALGWAQLDELSERDARTLSGGEQQRVALARVHALKPALWLLDEPTANLDGASREQVISLLANLTQSGTTVMIATHDRDLLTRASLSRLKLQDGQLVNRP